MAIFAVAVKESFPHFPQVFPQVKKKITPANRVAAGVFHKTGGNFPLVVIIPIGLQNNSVLLQKLFLFFQDRLSGGVCH